MLIPILIAHPHDVDDRCKAGVMLWKATRLPAGYLCTKIAVDEKKLKKAIKLQISEWKLMGKIENKTDVLGDVFAKYYPELRCIRYTLQEIIEMDGNYNKDLCIGEII